MSLTDINKVIPYYYQIKADILGQISRGELRENSKIASENELARLYGVSRPTVRQAINELVFAGILWRRQGRGTFVSPSRIDVDLVHYMPFFEEAASAGQKPELQIISCHTTRATAEVAKLLLISEGDELYELVGVRHADHRPVKIISSYFPVARFPGLDQCSFPQGVAALIKVRYGVFPTEAKQTLQVVIAREQDAELLNVRAGFPLIMLEGVIYGENSQPYAIERALYRSDRMRFHIHQVRDNIVAAGISHSEHKLTDPRHPA